MRRCWQIRWALRSSLFSTPSPLPSGWPSSGSSVTRGASAVAGQALLFKRRDAQLHAALVNGAAGVVVTVSGRPLAVMGIIVAAGRIVEIDVIAEPERVGRVAAAVLAEQ